MTLLPKACYREVVASVMGLLAQVPWARRWRVPGGEVFGRRRRELGVAVFERLYWLLAGRVAAEPVAAGRLRVGGLLLCALDGFQARVPATRANRRAFGYTRTTGGDGPYPLVRVVVATVCATRAQLGAAFDASRVGEQTLTARLAEDHPGVFAAGLLYLTDRNFLGAPLIFTILRCGAHLLMRVKSDIRLPRVGPWLPDGSYRSYLTLKVDGAESCLPVRVVEYDVVVDGAPGELFCLVTDLLDCQAYPAAELCGAYPQRWGGSETHIKENKSTITGAGPSAGPILRSTTPQLVGQELWAWLTSTQLVRAHGRAAAATTRPAQPPAAERELAPREISFTATLRETTRSLTTSAVTATTSPARLAAANRHAHDAITVQPVQVDRNRHRPRVTKTRLDFPPARGPVRTTTGPAEVILQAPTPAARSG
jgi:hypothetical protein